MEREKEDEIVLKVCNKVLDYDAGFIVGALTTLTIMGPMIVIISIINQLPDPFKFIGIISVVVYLFLGMLRTFRRVEKFIRRRLFGQLVREKN